MIFTTDVQYFILVASLFLIPRALLRFQFPAALTAFVMGFAVSVFLGWFQGEQTLYLLSVLGITSLFLFAGLEVDVEEIRKNWLFYSLFLTAGMVVMFLTTLGVQSLFHVDFRPAALITLGLITPSTGFILDSLKTYQLSSSENDWVRSLAIALEILALTVLFFVLQSSSTKTLSISLISVVGMIFILPILFYTFAKIIMPFSPQSEFSFLILLALFAGVITRYLGTYYLVGAFIVGLSARRFEHYFPELQEDKSLGALRLFFSFFVPFYFFRAGSLVSIEDLSFLGLLIGLGFLAVFAPIRYFMVGGAIKYLGNSKTDNQNLVSLLMLPNLVFGLVIIGILREQFHVSSDLLTGLLVYTVTVSYLPSLIYRKERIQVQDMAL